MSVVAEARLRGMRREAPCTLIATTNDSSDAERLVFSKCTILEAPENLPDGFYEVSFGTQIAFLRRHAGCWSIGDVQERDQTQAVAFLFDAFQQKYASANLARVN